MGVQPCQVLASQGQKAICQGEFKEGFGKVAAHELEEQRRALRLEGRVGLGDTARGAFLSEDRDSLFDSVENVSFLGWIATAPAIENATHPELRISPVPDCIDIEVGS